MVSSLVIKISDNGCGINPEMRSQIFDMLFSMSKTQGCGLGLSYCKQVVESHGGTIEVVSEVDLGTTFTVTLPDCILKNEQNCVVPAEEKGKGAILIVDDDEEMIERWKIILKDFTGTIITARSGSEVLTLDIAALGIDRAVVDQRYKGSYITGLEIIEFLKSKRVREIHLCTGLYNDSEICERAKALGVTSIIPKPIPSQASRLFV